MVRETRTREGETRQGRNLFQDKTRSIVFYKDVIFLNHPMKKILFSILLILFCGQIFAQHKPDNASFRSASVLKLNIFAPLLGYSQFSWEKPIGHLRSIEFGLGVIGAGKNLHIQRRPLFSLDRFGANNYRPGHRNQFGGFFEFGYKFIVRINSIEISPKNISAVSNLKGPYIKPSFIIGAYSFNQFRNDSTAATIRRHHHFGALLLNLGYQWVFTSKIVFELYMGGGAEIDNVRGGDDLYGHPFVLAVAKDNPSVNFACTAGFRFGFLFK